LLRFLRHNETRTVQFREIGRVPLTIARQECAHVGDGSKISPYLDYRVDERALAVRASAIGKNECVFTCESGEAISDVALQELLQLGIAIGDAIEEGSP